MLHTTADCSAQTRSPVLIGNPMQWLFTHCSSLIVKPNMIRALPPPGDDVELNFVVGEGAYGKVNAPTSPSHSAHLLYSSTSRTHALHALTPIH